MDDPKNENNLVVVRKHDKLLQDSIIKDNTETNMLSVSEQRIYYYIMSKIDPVQSYETPLTGSIYDYCKEFGLSYNGRVYKEFQTAITALRQKHIWVTERDEDGTIHDVLCGYISNAITTPGKGTYSVFIDKFMSNYIMRLNPSESITYNVGWLAKCKSKYTATCYEVWLEELKRNNMTEGTVTFELEAFTKKIHAEKKAYISTLERDVLTPVMSEINSFGPYHVSMKKEKVKTDNGSCTMLSFNLKIKDGRTAILNVSFGSSTESMADDDLLPESRNILHDCNWVELTQEEYDALLAKYGPDNGKEILDFCIADIDKSATRTNNERGWKNWPAVITSYFENGWAQQNYLKAAAKKENEETGVKVKRKYTKRQAYGKYGWVKLSDEEYQRLINSPVYGKEKTDKAIEYLDEKAEKTGNEKHYKDWEPLIRTYIDKDWIPQANTQSTNRKIQKRVYTGKAEPEEEIDPMIKKMLRDKGLLNDTEHDGE